MPLAAGVRLGPYEVGELLGAGGMAEVYRAHDPRLGRDVAVKIVLTDGEPAPDRLRRFEEEARTVAALSHPNVLTVFDVGTSDGRPYLVLELLDGETLRQRLERGAMPLRSAVELAIEVCHGLEAAHARSVVHCDLKPDNLFLTADGRVKILDFGIARLTRPSGRDPADTDTKPGLLLGTVGYVSPEQARGLVPDGRADVFALGAILYEALSGRRAFGGASAADTIAAVLHDDPPPLRVALGPVPSMLDRVVRRCLHKDPGERFHSAHDLALALEALLDRPLPGAGPAGAEEERNPYPGLRAFTEADAGRFFGREAEVERVWGRLRHERLLGVIGPSGAGKTSFVRAGVAAMQPTGWAVIVCTPGPAPFQQLGQCLAPHLAGDPEALRLLVRFDDPDSALALLARWRRGYVATVVIVDQLEELFTLNPPERQARFAALLGRLTEEADVRVVLSMRDDFLMRCHEHEGLRPVFDGLVPLGAPSGDALRRALVEPARAEGCSFEEGLPEEMLAAVEGERGAPAPRLLRGAPLGRARPGEPAALPCRLRAGRGCRGRPGPARRGDPGADRGRAAGPGAGDPEEPRDRREHARLGRPRGAALGLCRPPGVSQHCTLRRKDGSSPPVPRGCVGGTRRRARTWCCILRPADRWAPARTGAGSWPAARPRGPLRAPEPGWSSSPSRPSSCS
jgi:hypothetical protein